MAADGGCGVVDWCRFGGVACEVGGEIGGVAGVGGIKDLVGVRLST